MKRRRRRVSGIGSARPQDQRVQVHIETDARDNIGAVSIPQCNLGGALTLWCSRGNAAAEIRAENRHGFTPGGLIRDLAALAAHEGDGEAWLLARKPLTGC